MVVKKFFNLLASVIGFTLLINTLVFGRAETVKPVYLDPDQPIKLRVEDLLSRMTLKEKVGQMNMARQTLDQDEDREFVRGTLRGIGPGCGFFRVEPKLKIRERVKFFNELQNIAIEETRLGIPLIMVEEGVHGLLIPSATIFPEGFAIASSWNMDLVEQIYAVAAKEARVVGIQQLCSLVIEVIRDPRQGRNEEGYSEDPYLCSRIAEAIVYGTQGQDVSADDKVVVTLTAYPGQAQPVSGLDEGEIEISERVLREVFLPPWRAGIKAGALSIMATYPAIDGVLAHGSKKLLTDILRGELGFEGFVLTEGAGFRICYIRNRVVPTQKQAGELSIKAGVDVAQSLEPGYLEPLIENVEEGRVSMESIDTAVRRALRVKFLLGLFDKPPYVDAESAIKLIHCTEHERLALQTAREGIVLLKNQKNLLPLDKKIKSIAVIGPNADHKTNQLGDYRTRYIQQEVVTVLDGIKSKVSPQTKVTYVKGCNVFKTDLNEIAEAQAAARGADVAIVVLGENERYHPDKTGTVGEGRDIAKLELTGLQNDLVEAVVASGTPTVVVLINGRPLAISWIAENVPAIVEAWNCGERGGEAVADVIFGDYNPSGRLPITFPRHAGQLPVYYNYKPTKAALIKKNAYVDISATPLFEFGCGLSYTDFEYSNLEIAPKPPAKRFGPAAEVYVSLEVKNVGKRKGCEVVQLYINDLFSSVTTPVKVLSGFSKIELEPGGKKKVEFTITPYQLSFLDRHLERIVEPGTFEVMVGASSEDIRLKGSFEVED